MFQPITRESKSPESFYLQYYHWIARNERAKSPAPIGAPQSHKNRNQIRYPINLDQGTEDCIRLITSTQIAYMLNICSTLYIIINNFI